MTWFVTLFTKQFCTCLSILIYNDYLQDRLYEHKFSLILFYSTFHVHETGVETEATAPSTTAGPGFDGVPVPLVLAAAEFLWAWAGISVEFKDGLTDSSVRKTNQNTLIKQWIRLLLHFRKHSGYSKRLKKNIGPEATFNCKREANCYLSKHCKRC